MPTRDGREKGNRREKRGQIRELFFYKPLTVKKCTKLIHKDYRNPLRGSLIPGFSKHINLFLQEKGKKILLQYREKKTFDHLTFYCNVLKLLSSFFFLLLSSYVWDSGKMGCLHLLSLLYFFQIDSLKISLKIR